MLFEMPRSRDETPVGIYHNAQTRTLCRNPASMSYPLSAIPYPLSLSLYPYIPIPIPIPYPLSAIACLLSGYRAFAAPADLMLPCRERPGASDYKLCCSFVTSGLVRGDGGFSSGASLPAW